MTLNEFLSNLKTDIKTIESLYQGLTITELSLPNFSKNTQNSYHDFFYIEAVNNKKSIKLYVPKTVLDTAKENGHIINQNVSVDITIDSLSFDSKSIVLIKISKIVESGISEQNIFIRNLTKYCDDNKLFERTKKPIPTLIKKIAIISTIHSTTEKDIINILNYKNETHSFRVSPSSEAIANQINLCQNSDFDMIILYRGGNEDYYMNIYSDVPVLNAIHKSSIHVGVALGHYVDTPFVNKIADSYYATPNNLAQVVNENNTFILNQFDSLISQYTNYFQNNVFYNKLHNSISMNIERIEHSTSKIIHSKSNTLNNLDFNINNMANKILHNCEIQSNNTYSTIDSNTSSMINNIHTQMVLSNEKINTLVDNLQQNYDVVLNTTISNVDKYINLVQINMQNKLVESNSNISSLSNIIIERMNTNLLSTNNNIQSALSNIELNITHKKNKRMNRILIIALFVVISIAAILVVKYT